MDHQSPTDPLQAFKDLFKKSEDSCCIESSFRVTSWIGFLDLPTHAPRTPLGVPCLLGSSPTANSSTRSETVGYGGSVPRSHHRVRRDALDE